MVETEEVEVHIKDIESKGHDYSCFKHRLVPLSKSRIEEEDGTVFCFISSFGLVCQKCGKHARLEENQDGTYIVKGEPCEIPYGGLSISNTISIPSGKMLVCNSYDPYREKTSKWQENNEKHISINSLRGQKEWIDLCEKFNLGYVMTYFSPDLFHDTSKNTYVLASHDEEYHWGQTGEDKETPLPEGWERKAGTITDLWAAVILDLEQWEKDGGEPIDKDFNGGVVEVPAGRYKITQHLQQDLSDREPDDQGVTWFADVELIEAY